MKYKDVRERWPGVRRRKLRKEDGKRARQRAVQDDVGSNGRVGRALGPTVVQVDDRSRPEKGVECDVVQTTSRDAQPAGEHSLVRYMLGAEREGKAGQPGEQAGGDEVRQRRQQQASAMAVGPQRRHQQIPSRRKEPGEDASDQADAQLGRGEPAYGVRPESTLEATLGGKPRPSEPPATYREQTTTDNEQMVDTRNGVAK